MPANAGHERKASAAVLLRSGPGYETCNADAARNTCNARLRAVAEQPEADAVYVRIGNAGTQTPRLGSLGVRGVGVPGAHATRLAPAEAGGGSTGGSGCLIGMIVVMSEAGPIRPGRSSIHQGDGSSP